MWYIVGVVFFAILFSALVIVLAVVAWRSPFPENTTACAMTDIYEISDRTLKIRTKILHSQIDDRLQLADELLYISDDVKDAASRLMAASIEESIYHNFNRPMGGISW